MKVAPLIRELTDRGHPPAFIHTGQHYDQAMSGSLFADLGLREPDANFGVGSGSHAMQTAKVMERFDAWLDDNSVDAVVVVGDVNSTVACTLVAVKRNIPVAHVEAGLRSFDRTMPEEINRLVVDALSRWLLTPSPDADANLLAEGVDPSRIVRVGNIMADSLFQAVDRAAQSQVLDRVGIRGSYALVTLHRPALVDDPDRLRDVLQTLEEIPGDLQFLYPVHPRTKQNLERFGITLSPRFCLTEPLGYLDFVHAQANARLVLTDSGGVQEETTMLGVPCLTLRENTERPITISEGTNTLVGFSREKILAAANQAASNAFQARRPEMWDGKTSGRVADLLISDTSRWPEQGQTLVHEIPGQAGPINQVSKR